jgi:hypothetical protein
MAADSLRQSVYLASGIEEAREGKMSETKRQYAANDRKPPLHTRFKKGQSGNPRGRPKKNLPALLVAALNEPMFARIDGERRKITKREAVIHQLVNKSAGADLRATKMLIDMMKDTEKKAGATPPPEPAPYSEADEEVIKFTVQRIESAILQEIQDQNAGHRVGWADHTGYANDCLRRRVAH